MFIRNQYSNFLNVKILNSVYSNSKCIVHDYTAIIFQLATHYTSSEGIKCGNQLIVCFAGACVSERIVDCERQENYVTKLTIA